MDFSSPVFLFIFLPLVLSFHLVSGRRNWITTLIVLSVFYYAWIEPVFVFPLLSIICANYAYIAVYHRNNTSIKSKKVIKSLAIIFNLLPLLICKYGNFVLHSLAGLVPALDGTAALLATIPQPLGISFFTFMNISFLLDNFRAEPSSRRNLREIMLFSLFFPKIAAGPIVQFNTFTKQLPLPKKNTWDNINYGIKRFIRGLAKKILIANVLGATVDKIFAIPVSELTFALAWFGAIAYAIQIYFDFAGYSDMAIGLGRMFGFNLGENFNYPYIATSIKDFWKRWHISLSNWFQTYIFLPTAFKSLRQFKKDTYLGIKSENWSYFLASFVTMVLCGLWHGANWTFIVWGFYHGLLLIIERAWLAKMLKKKNRLLKIILTQILVVFGWTIFRSPNLVSAFEYFKPLIGLSKGNPVLHYFPMYWDNKILITFILGLLLSFPIIDTLKGKLTNAKILKHHFVDICSRPVIAACYYILFILSAMQIAGSNYNPFIYNRF